MTLNDSIDVMLNYALRGEPRFVVETFKLSLGKDIHLAGSSIMIWLNIAFNDTG